MAIKIDGEVMRAEAGKMRQYKEQHINAINSLKNTVAALANSESFDGATATKYRAQFEGLNGTFSQFEEMLENLARDLELAAQKFEAADNG